MLKDYFRNDPDVIEVKYMPKELALKDLQESLGPMNSVLAGFTDNPLPSSFELKLKGEALDPARISQKTFRLKGLAGVDDVQYGEKWLASLFTMTRGVKIVTGILSVVIFIAIAFVTYSTIKILFYRRIEEIETLKLLGATRGFIRLPFLLEGTFVGTAGGVMGLIGLSVIYSFTTSRIIEFLPSLRGMLIFFPSSTYLAAPLVGAVLSLAGSFLAIGKIKY
ncbi:MAG: FtsX-like permease family protein [Nitrospirae bacterium]|nr:FtsX-like permease family protein [Nitrospirota bacterium]